MRYHIFLLFLQLCYLNTQAQHCPYDRGHLIVIKATGKDGKSPPSVNTFFYLQEVDNNMADSCASVPKLIRKEFINNYDFMQEYSKTYNNNGYDSALNKRLTIAGVLKKGNKIVCLNQAENSCTLKSKSETVFTNYEYRQRKFIVTYMVNGIEMSKPLPPECITSLCTSNEDLKSFKTFIIKL